MRQQDTRES